MTPYLSKLEFTIRHHWNLKALCDYNGASYCYSDLAKNIELFRLFFEKSGIGRGVKIALCARNSASWAMTFWGINVFGCVTVPLLADFHPDGITTLVNHSDSILLFTDADIWSRLNPEDMPVLKAAINVGDGTLLWHRDENTARAWEGRSAAFDERFPKGMVPEDVSYPSDNEGDLALINYTSGTSGDPKGVMLTYGAISDTDDFANAHFPNTPGQTIVSMLPMAHMYGLAIEFIHPNVDGVAVYFLGKAPSPTTLMAAMKDVKPYMVVTVPLVMEKVYSNSIKPALAKLKGLVAIPLLRRLVFNKIRSKLLEAFGGNVGCFIMGGAPLKPEVERCFRRIRLPFTVGYGMTEACPLIAYEWWTDFAPGSCGKPVHEVRIDSKDPQHTPGEIQARGANLTVGYYKNPEANATAFTEDGWFRTGDLGVMDKKRNIFIRGRIKSMILGSSGQNIYPEEIEAVLSSIQYVEESVVVERDGKIVALVYPANKDELDEETMKGLPETICTLANASLAKYSQINRVELVEKPFEKTPKFSIKRYLYK